MAEEVWLLGGEPDSGSDESRGSIKTASEPAGSTARTGTVGAMLTFAMPDSGPMNSEWWC